ncbi:MAG TPA: hypothetical protein PKC21_01025 [Oligoflexia bacterium]|nr:hypothetical protein [Oligoflexia bacterium]HMR23911.1 hypothetical protein [Oligoflexia bacterium]
MMKKLKHLKIFLLLMLTFLASCAQNEFGSVRLVINGQEQEVRIRDVDCINDFNFGNNGMSCIILIQNGSGISDTVRFNIADVVNIYDNFLGANLDPLLSPFDSVEATVNGNTVGILAGSIVVFSSITNVPGGQVCVDYFKLNLGFGTNGFMEGDFCARVQ